MRGPVSRKHVRPLRPPAPPFHLQAGGRHFLAIVCRGCHGARAISVHQPSGAGAGQALPGPLLCAALPGQHHSPRRGSGRSHQTAFHPISDGKTQERRFSGVKVNMAVPRLCTRVLSRGALSIFILLGRYRCLRTVCLGKLPLLN